MLFRWGRERESRERFTGKINSGERYQFVEIVPNRTLFRAVKYIIVLLRVGGSGMLRNERTSRDGRMWKHKMILNKPGSHLFGWIP